MHERLLVLKVMHEGHIEDVSKRVKCASKLQERIMVFAMVLRISADARNRWDFRNKMKSSPYPQKAPQYEYYCSWTRRIDSLLFI